MKDEMKDATGLLFTSELPANSGESMRTKQGDSGADNGVNPPSSAACAGKDTGKDTMFVVRNFESLLVRRSALFSACERYRYMLTIIWSDDLPLINFLMLNPSTADEAKDDPTVAKVITWARLWGYGGVIVTNLFAIRSTDPKVMLKAADPEGDANDVVIMDAARRCKIVVLAWGKDGNHRGRADFVWSALTVYRHKLMALKVTKREPWHPLYLRNDTVPFGYDREKTPLDIPEDATTCLPN